MIDHTIVHHEKGRTFDSEIRRIAVRAIIRKGARFLLIHSSAAGDYKFPGGGIEDGETEVEALRREVREECGMLLSGVGEKALRISELRQSKESAATVFKMISDYYFCTIDEADVGQELDPYEKALGFRPVWIELGRALEVDRLLLTSPGRRQTWVEREIWAMEAISRI